MEIVKTLAVVLFAHWLMGVYQEAYEEHYGKETCDCGEAEKVITAEIEEIIEVI